MLDLMVKTAEVPADSGFRCAKSAVASTWWMCHSAFAVLSAGASVIASSRQCESWKVTVSASDATAETTRSTGTSSITGCWVSGIAIAHTMKNSFPNVSPARSHPAAAGTPTVRPLPGPGR